MSSKSNAPQPPRPSGEGASVPYPASRRRVVTLLAVLPWPLVLFEYLFVFPRYEKMYREYGLKLPDGTQYLLELSRWVQAHSILAIVLTMALTAASVFAANGVLTVRWSRLRRNLVLLVLFGVPCVLFVVSWLGVLSTQSKLIEGLHK